MFTEGYLSSHAGDGDPPGALHEAIRLAAIWRNNPAPDSGDVRPLALMHLHAATDGRSPGRNRRVALLEEQNRELWTQGIQVGLEWWQIAQGDSFSRYHAEAGSAAEHCLPPRSGDSLDKVVECYSLLNGSHPPRYTS